MLLKSIKSRVLLTSLAVLVGFMLLTAAVLETAVETRMMRAENDKLEALMYSILGAVDQDNSGMSITVSDARLFENGLFNNESGLYAFLYDTKKELWRSLSASESFYNPTDLAEEELRFSQLEYNGEQWFQLAFSIHWPNINDQLSLYQLVIWKNASGYLTQLERFKNTLRLWFLVTIALLLVTMWLVLRWSLRPLRQIGEEVQAIENDHKERFDSDYPSEIKPLTQNLNLLLQREKHQMQRYRHALDDLAHSLKTPLAVLTGLAESATDFTQDDRNSLQEQCQRMNQIVSYQLQKAVTVGGDSITPPIRLAQLLEKTVNALGKVYRDKGIRIELQGDFGVNLRMDESDLLELLGNLIDNACKYGQKRVLISAIPLNDRLQISIEDDGSGLQQDQMKTILTRGTRLDQSQEGQGIGLAVVHDIIEAYEMNISLFRSELGGLKVLLDFTNI